MKPTEKMCSLIKDTFAMNVAGRLVFLFLGLIHAVENMSLIAATSDLYVASTRDLVASDRNVAEGFCRRIKSIIS